MKYYPEDKLPKPIQRNTNNKNYSKGCSKGYEKIYPIDKKLRQDGCYDYLYLCKCNCGQYFSKWSLYNKDCCGLCKGDIIGKKYNHLTVLRKLPPYIERPYKNNSSYYECECDCDNHTIIRTSRQNIVSGDVKSCGCIKRKVPKYDKREVEVTPHCGIYRFQNIYNGKSYVGKTHNFKNRYREHYEYKSDPARYTKQLYQAFDKYGFENFNFFIEKDYEQPPSEQELSRMEEYYIKKYDCYHNGYNASEYSSGGFYSQEHLEKCTKILEELNKKQKGVNHPRTNLSEELIKNIFNNYAMKGAPSRYVWNKFKEELNENYKTFESFKQLYYGQRFTELLPDNWDKRPIVRGNCVIWGEDIVLLRQRYQQGENPNDLYKEYKDKYHFNYSFSYFNQIAKGKRYTLCK